jgi:Na+-translocating ferredoxin:NAD+ oxidoreductase subunit A
MSISTILQIAVGAVLINNFILARMLGLCPFLCGSRSLATAVGMGITVTFIMGIATACTWTVTAVILVPYAVAYLQIIVFVLIIATLVQLTEIAMFKFSPKLHESLGVHCPLITADCVVLASSLIAAQSNPLTGQPFSFAEACVSGIGSGIGFTVVLILMAGIRDKLELAHGRKSLQGLPLVLIVAGLMAMAFFGFTGLHFSPARGGF